jgi:hypothetical protein
MSEKVFLLWNGWGIIFSLVYIMHLLAFIGLVNKLGATPLRIPVSIIGWISVGLVFLLSGWIAGVVTIPLGIVIGVPLARLLFPLKQLGSGR